jgi:NitT/TauT family transport system permease protein
MFFPSPEQVWIGFKQLARDGTLLLHVRASLTRIMIGFILGSIVGVPLGLLMGIDPFYRRLLTPYVGFFRFVPPIAMIIFAIVWFGSGETSKIFLVFFSTVFVVILNVEAGVRSVARNKIRAALSMGARPQQLLLHVLLPACTPFILTGMRIAMGGAFAVIVAAELISSEDGIGFLLESSRVFLQSDRIFIAVVTLGVMGFITDRIFRLLVRYCGGEYAAQRSGD